MKNNRKVKITVDPAAINPQTLTTLEMIAQPVIYPPDNNIIKEIIEPFGTFYLAISSSK